MKFPSLSLRILTHPITIRMAFLFLFLYAIIYDIFAPILERLNTSKIDVLNPIIKIEWLGVSFAESE